MCSLPRAARGGGRSLNVLYAPGGPGAEAAPVPSFCFFCFNPGRPRTLRLSGDRAHAGCARNSSACCATRCKASKARWTVAIRVLRRKSIPIRTEGGNAYGKFDVCIRTRAPRIIAKCSACVSGRLRRPPTHSSHLASGGTSRRGVHYPAPSHH